MSTIEEKPVNLITKKIMNLEAINEASRTNIQKKNLLTLTGLKRGLTRRNNYQRTVDAVKAKAEAGEALTEENKGVLSRDEEYRKKEDHRTDLSQCIFNTLDEGEQKEVVATMKRLTESFTPNRKLGEGLGFIAPVATSSVSVTTGSIATLASAGAAVAATGPFAIPITVGLIAIGAICGFYYRQKALNSELQGNLIAIKGETERLYFIYKVMEKIAKEKNLNINTFLVQKFTILLTNNILTIAGPEVFALLKKTILENPASLFTPETLEKKITKPDGSVAVLKLDETKSMEQIKKDRSAWSIFSPSPAIQRLVIPGELLRIIIRDVTILSIFFTILQSEFDLLVREYDAVQKKELLSVLSADASLSQPVKDAFQKYLKTDSWLESDEYIRFKCNLPFNNLDVVQTAEQAIIGGVGFEAAGELPAASASASAEAEAKPEEGEAEEAETLLTNVYPNNTSTASNPLEEVAPAPPPAQGALKGGRRAQSKRTSVFAVRGLSM